jgi:NhaP-type Na+/H+ or K+/H+ antiporter
MRWCQPWWWRDGLWSTRRSGSCPRRVIFLLESVVFSLIGLQLPTLIRALSGSQAWLAEALAVAGTLIVIRIVWVFPLSAVTQRRSDSGRLSWPVPAVV